MQANIWNFKCWVKETEPRKLYRVLGSLTEQAGFHVMGFTEHYFDPQGYSALWLLAESHLAVHTFPEEACTYVELSSCNEAFYEKFKQLVDNNASLLGGILVK